MDKALDRAEQKNAEDQVDQLVKETAQKPRQCDVCEKQREMVDLDKHTRDHSEKMDWAEHQLTESIHFCKDDDECRSLAPKVHILFVPDGYKHPKSVEAPVDSSK